MPEIYFFTNCVYNNNQNDAKYSMSCLDNIYKKKYIALK